MAQSPPLAVNVYRAALKNDGRLPAPHAKTAQNLPRDRVVVVPRLIKAAVEPAPRVESPINARNLPVFVLWRAPHHKLHSRQHEIHITAINTRAACQRMVRT